VGPNSTLFIDHTKRHAGETVIDRGDSVSHGGGIDFDRLQPTGIGVKQRRDTNANGTDHRTPLWEAYEGGGVVLLDEVDNGNPNLLAALNSALSNGHCVFGSGTVVERHPDFRVVATANTAGLGPENGFIGRNGVDLATRDRFVTVQVPIDDMLEDALAEVHIGAATIAELHMMFQMAAKANLERRSVGKEQPNPKAIVKTVRKLRAVVDVRFRGSVVSPRTTIQAATMVAAGFTLAEALVAKLPGLTTDEVESVLRSAGIEIGS